MPQSIPVALKTSAQVRSDARDPKKKNSENPSYFSSTYFLFYLTRKRLCPSNRLISLHLYMHTMWVVRKYMNF